ncbi:unnamed protein product [Aphanomyces euteiches]
MDVVSWLHNHRKEGCSDDAMRSAINMRRVDMVQFLCAHGYDALSEAWHMAAAARSGSLEIVKCLLLRMSGNVSQMDLALKFAAELGHFDVLTHLFKHAGSKCHSMVLDAAASNGHLDIVRFLHESNQPCSTLAMDQASEHGQLDVIKYMHSVRSEGCTKAAIERAATNGHTEVVYYLVEQVGAPCSVFALTAAAAHGYGDIVRYLVERVRRPWQIQQAVRLARANGHPKVAEYLDNIEDRR